MMTKVFSNGYLPQSYTLPSLKIINLSDTGRVGFFYYLIIHTYDNSLNTKADS